MTRPLPQPVEQERAALQELVLALSYAQGLDAVTDALGAFPGITAEGVRLLLTIPQVRGLVRLAPRPSAHAAVQAAHRVNLMRRAAYLTQAARRLSTAAGMGPDAVARALVTERRYLQAHLEANAQREVVAGQVAAVARQQQRVGDPHDPGLAWNGLLGWYAVVDSLTSPECRRANRRNFDPNQVPSIGFPGAVHANCRCKPGPPFKTDLRVEVLKSDYKPAGRTTARRVSLRA
jgi:hypothetical protein